MRDSRFHSAPALSGSGRVGFVLGFAVLWWLARPRVRASRLKNYSSPPRVVVLVVRTDGMCNPCPLFRCAGLEQVPGGHLCSRKGSAPKRTLQIFPPTNPAWLSQVNALVKGHKPSGP